jgi:hypothetical protein
MTSYWYSTNGMSQRRLSNRHLSILDQAFERHARIQIFDDDVFGQNITAIANPYQGTMTAGDLHFGLYRQPPMWRMSDTSLDTLILMDQIDDNSSNNKNSNHRHINGDGNINNNETSSDASLDSSNHGVIINNNGRNNNSGNIYKYISRKRIVTTNTNQEENCICCRIS